MKWTKTLITKNTKFQSLGSRKAIVAVSLNTDVTWVQLKTRQIMKLGNEIKMLGNTFGSIFFNSLKISLAKIRKLQVFIETDLSL